MTEAKITEGAITAILNFIKDNLKTIWSTITQKKIIFIEIPHKCLWAPASIGAKPAMQIVTSWYVTNNSQRSIRLLDARLLKPKVKNLNCRTTLFMVHRESNSVRDGLDMAINPNQTGVMDVTFFVDPPMKKPGESLTLRLAVKDQYGKEYKTFKIKIESI